MEDNVSINLNLSTGEVNIEAPADSLGTIFENLESFLPKLSASKSNYTREQPGSEPQEQPAIEQDGPSDASVVEPNKQPLKRKKTSQSKKPESYNMVDLGLEPAQRESLRSFYKEKKPKTQNEQLLVIMAWLKDNAGKLVITKDEIYTGLKTVEERIPARISSVLSNLGIDGRIIAEADGYKIHHTGEDYVRFKLPQTDVQK